MCAMLDRGASGRMHQRWAQAIEATIQAHLAINDRLEAAAKSALESESLALTDRIAKLVTAVAPYRNFVETALVKIRAKQRVADFLVDESQRATSGAASTLRDDIQRAIPGGLAAIWQGKPLSRVLGAGRDATIDFARRAAARLGALPDNKVFAFKASAIDGLERAADLLERFVTEERDQIQPQRLPLKAGVEREVFALREFLAQMNGRLRSYFPQSFIDSLYPELESKNGALAENDDDEDTTPESGTPPVPPA